MIRSCFHKFAEKIEYPRTPPFDPPEIFPEFSKNSGGETNIDRTNKVFPAVRQLLFQLDLDAANFGTNRWNPFKEFVTAGKNVLLKPNLVTHKHRKGPEALFWTISHPAIIRALFDYAYLAVGSSGKIVIGDTPIENCDFDILCDATGLKEMVEILRGRGYRNLELLDFRTYQTIQYPDSSVAKINLPGDPWGYTDIDLGKASLLQELEDAHGPQNYYTLGDHSVDHINPHERAPGLPNRFHSNGKHIYRIPNSVLNSDFVVSIAKMKTHRFSGVTLCLKNAVGICQGKEYMPHRRPGTPQEGGDSFPSYPSAKYVGWLKLKRAAYSAIGNRNVQRLMPYIRRVYPERLPHEINSEPLYGDWHGNDTVWRMTLDLNLILFHADSQGFDLTSTKRTYLGVIDGIIGMDHEAPMEGLPVKSNVLVIGRDPVSTDTLGTFLMGFDPVKIKTINNANTVQCKCLGKVNMGINFMKGNMEIEVSKSLFVPTKGWEYILNNNV